MDEKLEFVTLASGEGANVRELCRRFGVSPTTGYKWLSRHEAAGVAGLEDLVAPAARLAVAHGAGA